MIKRAVEADDEEFQEIWEKYKAGQAHPHQKESDLEELLSNQVLRHFIEAQLKEFLKDPEADKFNDSHDKYECPYHEDCTSCDSLDEYSRAYPKVEEQNCDAILYTCDNGLKCYFAVGYVIIKGQYGRGDRLKFVPTGNAKQGRPILDYDSKRELPSNKPYYQDENNTYMTKLEQHIIEHMERCDKQKELREQGTSNQ